VQYNHHAGYESDEYEEAFHLGLRRQTTLASSRSSVKFNLCRSVGANKTWEVLSTKVERFPIRSLIAGVQTAWVGRPVTKTERSEGTDLEYPQK
jgi:hypothetical protein